MHTHEFGDIKDTKNCVMLKLTSDLLWMFPSHNFKTIKVTSPDMKKWSDYIKSNITDVFF